MPEVLTPKLTREEFVRRLESLQAQFAELQGQFAELVVLARETTGAQEPERKAPAVLTPRMVAARWLCTENHIRNLIRRGELRAFKAGGTLLRLWIKDVEEFEQSQSGNGPSGRSGESAAPSSGDTTNGDRAHHELLTRARLDNLRKRHVGNDAALHELSRPPTQPCLPHAESG